MTQKWYIAGPFFNPEQLSLIQKIEQTFVDADVAFFSPRLCDENKKGKLSSEDAAVIFKRNVDNLEDCTTVLAIIDWRMPEGQTLAGVRSIDTIYGMGLIRETPPLQIPDSGTVFEMGYAYKLAKPIYIYTERPLDDKINVMLAQACIGVIGSPGDLFIFLRTGLRSGLTSWRNFQ